MFAGRSGLASGRLAEVLIGSRISAYGDARYLLYDKAAVVVSGELRGNQNVAPAVSLESFLHSGVEYVLLSAAPGFCGSLVGVSHALGRHIEVGHVVTLY